jgi:hypothetical protein
LDNLSPLGAVSTTPGSIVGAGIRISTSRQLRQAVSEYSIAHQLLTCGSAAYIAPSPPCAILGLDALPEGVRKFVLKNRDYWGILHIY